MKNKGFTLVEIVISLVILVAIGLVVGIGLNKILNKNSDEDKETIVNRITSSADIYLSNNSAMVTELYSTKGYLIIKVSDLISEGLLDDDLVNPETGEKIGATSSQDFVMVSLDANGILKFTYNPDEIKEGYLEAQNKTIEYSTTANAYVCNNLSTYISNHETEWGTPALRLVDKDGAVYTGSISNIITGIDCNVNAAKPGTYQITYTYILPDTQVTKSYTRTVIVTPSLNDITKLTATVNPSSVVINGTLTFSVTATNRKNETKTLGAAEYTISSQSTATVGTFTPTITFSGTPNSDGTKPTTTVSYKVIDNLCEIIKMDTNCTKEVDGSCWYKGNQSGNYVKYANKLWRVFQEENGCNTRIISEDTTGTNYAFTYYYIGVATQQVISGYQPVYGYVPNPEYEACRTRCGQGLHCCNQCTMSSTMYTQTGNNPIYTSVGITNGDQVYYTVPQNPNGLSTYLTSTIPSQWGLTTTHLNSSAKHNFSGYNNNLGAQHTQTVGLLSYWEYQKIANCSGFTCSSNYLVKSNSNWGLGTWYNSSALVGYYDMSTGGYGVRTSIPYYQGQSLYITTNGAVGTAGGYYKIGHITNAGTTLGVRPVVVLKPDVRITSGNGTSSNPYTVR